MVQGGIVGYEAWGIRGGDGSSILPSGTLRRTGECFETVGMWRAYTCEPYSCTVKTGRDGKGRDEQ